MHALRNSLLTAAVIIFGLFTVFGVVGAAWAELPLKTTAIDDEEFTVDVDEWVDLEGADIRDSTGSENVTILNEDEEEVIEGHYEWDRDAIAVMVTETCTSSGEPNNCVEDSESAFATYTYTAPSEEARQWIGTLEVPLQVLAPTVLIGGVLVVFGLVAFAAGSIPGLGGRNGRRR